MPTFFSRWVAPKGAFIILFSLLALQRQAACQGCSLYGMTYTPYRAIDECPTAEQVEEDIAILIKHTRRVRTYTTLCQTVNRVLLRHATEGTLSVLFGVWIDNVEKDKVEIDTLLEALSEFPDAKLDGIAVGNEVAFRNSMSESEVADLVVQTRGKIRQLAAEVSSDALQHVPVFTIDIIPKPKLVAVSDVVAVNVHPFYRLDLPQMDSPEEMSDKILEATIEQIDIYRNLAPNKKLIITEIGWPTDSVPYIEPNVGSPQIAYLFMKKFIAYASTHGIQYYFFEIFDSLWKKSWFPSPNSSLSEFNWGLYYADRSSPKFTEC